MLYLQTINQNTVKKKKKKQYSIHLYPDELR